MKQKKRSMKPTITEWNIQFMQNNRLHLKQKANRFHFFFILLIELSFLFFYLNMFIRLFCF